MEYIRQLTSKDCDESPRARLRTHPLRSSNDDSSPARIRRNVLPHVNYQARRLESKPSIQLDQEPDQPEFQQEETRNKPSWHLIDNPTPKRLTRSVRSLVNLKVAKPEVKQEIKLERQQSINTNVSRDSKQSSTKADNENTQSLLFFSMTSLTAPAVESVVEVEEVLEGDGDLNNNPNDDELEYSDLCPIDNYHQDLEEIIEDDQLEDYFEVMIISL